MSESNLLEARQVKLDYVKGITNPYPERFEKTHEIIEASGLPDGNSSCTYSRPDYVYEKDGQAFFFNYLRYVR